MELKKHQPPLSVEDQIENLKQLGLIIKDEQYAYEILNDISYFRLVKAFSLGLKPKNGKYNADVTFEQIKNLYIFNAKFRQLILSKIEKVEINLRCRIANYFSKTYGIFGYEKSENFNNEIYHCQFIEEIQTEVDRNSKSPFVINFQYNYEGGKIPLYALVELFSFGTLSKFYKNMKNQDKKEIAKTFGVGYTYLESWFESLSYVRNICAHYGRIYNAKLPKTPKLYKEYSELGIGNQRIYAILICLKHILNNDDEWKRFVDKIQDLLLNFPVADKHLMGFPDNWYSILLNKKQI